MQIGIVQNREKINEICVWLKIFQFFSLTKKHKTRVLVIVFRWGTFVLFIYWIFALQKTWRVTMHFLQLPIEGACRLIMLLHFYSRVLVWCIPYCFVWKALYSQNITLIYDFCLPYFILITKSIKFKKIFLYYLWWLLYLF